MERFLKFKGASMFQAFIVVLRESFESFLIVMIILSYLQKTGRGELVFAVTWGVACSILTSAALGYWLWRGANGPLWEGIFGVVSALLIAFFVIHMWRTAHRLKSEMEQALSTRTVDKFGRTAFWGVFAFTVFMISREGMETALLLIQIHEPQSVTGIAAGVVGAAAMSLLWLRCGHLINVKWFFQVTAIFLMLFVVQILIYSFHEFTEAGLLPGSEALHLATEPFSPEGLYGKWFTPSMVFFCALWLCGVWLADKIQKNVTKSAGASV